MLANLPAGVHSRLLRIITLSTGENVHFRSWKHKAAKLYKSTLKQGVFYRRDVEKGQIELMEEIPANNFDLAYEAVLPVLIERIEKNGIETPFTQAWLDDLEEADYDRLEAAALEEKQASQAAGEKNTGAASQAS